MAIPDFQTLMRPVLAFIAAAPQRRLGDVYEAMAEHFMLTDAERREMLPSGRALLMNNRVAWSISYLKKAGLLDAIGRALYAVTERGQAALRDGPDRITVSYLMGTSGTLVSAKASQTAISSIHDGEGELEQQTPEEVMERSWKTLRSDLEGELIDQIKEMSPAFFERLVVDVLVAMGYGGERRDAGRAVGQSGDGGIDGIIDEDPLGLDIIYLQAKRWEGVVGRPEIQKFAGALQGKRAKKGVFITTSTFTREARDYAGIIDSRLILIDGERLARLMIDHDVGVSTASRYVIKKIDSDYFSEG